MIHLLEGHLLTPIDTVRKKKTWVYMSTSIQLSIWIPEWHYVGFRQFLKEIKLCWLWTYYNKTKVANEVSATHDVSHNSKRGPMTIFYGIINMAVINGIIIFRESNCDKTLIKLRDFIHNLSLNLINNSLCTNVHLPRKTRKRFADHLIKHQHRSQTNG